MQVACFIFIQRRWVDDKKHMENMLDYFCDIREPLQLLLFPEGTDLTGEKKTMASILGPVWPHFSRRITHMHEFPELTKVSVAHLSTGIVRQTRW